MNRRQAGFPCVAAALVALGACVSTASASAPWVPRLGAEAGANFGQLSDPTIFGERNFWQLGGSDALTMTWQVRPRWVIRFAPGWERQSRKATSRLALFASGGVTQEYEFTEKLCFDRLALPVRAAFRPGASGWSIEGGAGAAWLGRVVERTESPGSVPIATSAGIAASRSTGTVDASIFEEFLGRRERTDLFHRWDVFVTGGVGWSHPLGHSNLHVRAAWQQGLVDLAKWDEVVRISSLGTTVGLSW